MSCLQSWYTDEHLKDLPMVLLLLIYIYEGCPSKSWTFVVNSMKSIYIYDTFSTNMGEITV